MEKTFNNYYQSLDLKRLQGLLSRRLQRDVSFVWQQERPLANSSGSAYYAPVVIEDDLCGWLQLEGEQAPDERDLQLAQETIELVLTTLIYSQGQRQQIQRLEDKYALMEERDVVDMNQFFRSQITSGEPRPLAPEKRWLLTMPCMIESPRAFDITRMAMELHSRTSRYAFLYWHEIDPIYRRQTSTLLQMGAVTIFVPDILRVSFDEQISLLNLVNLSQGPLQPLLITGTTAPYSELVRTPGLHAQLLEHLSSAYLRMSKPFRTYVDQGVIDFFIKSLVSRRDQELVL